MDIKKYLNNKDIELSNDDINIEKLEKDIRKGYVLSEEVDKAREETQKESTSKSTKKKIESDPKTSSQHADQEKKATENAQKTLLSGGHSQNLLNVPLHRPAQKRMLYFCILQIFALLMIPRVMIARALRSRCRCSTCCR